LLKLVRAHRPNSQSTCCRGGRDKAQGGSAAAGLVDRAGMKRWPVLPLPAVSEPDAETWRLLAELPTELKSGILCMAVSRAMERGLRSPARGSRCCSCL